MNESRPPQNKRPHSHDDFQKIKGIGRTIASILTGLGVLSFSELASYSPESLTEMLKDKLPPIALLRARPEEWIRQARELANEQAQADSTQERAVNTARGGSHTPRRDWREIADFFVSFGYQVDPSGAAHLATRIHHYQTDDLKLWDGIAAGELLTWMRDQAGLYDQEEPGWREEGPQLLFEGPAEWASMELQTEEPIQLEFSNLWVSEVTMPTPIRGAAHPGYLRVEGKLSLAGPARERYFGEQLEYTIDIYLVDTKTNGTMLAGSQTARLDPGQLQSHVEQDFPIPEEGRYQLYLIASLLTPAETAAQVQGPIILVDGD
jgi:hypothetical protein